MPAKKLSPKVIVTNRSALTAKYGGAGVAKIDAALKALVKADAARGFATRVIDLSRAGSKRKKVTDPADPAENKSAIDGVAKALRPEYLVLLGSKDVIPYQDLKNPLYDALDPDGDNDQYAYGDLPYACEAPYSRNIKDFLGPTRVVGRIPDLTGASSPGYLVRLLELAAAAKPGPVPKDAFALSTWTWQKSTRASVRPLLDVAPGVLTSPKSGPTYAPARLGAGLHFVNCHGSDHDRRFLGESASEQFPTAMDSRKLAGLKRGSVAAFECCYGAELYDPADAGGDMSISNAYLKAGVHGVVASSTIAYGPPDDNANADVICRVFLEKLIAGASLGRAFLEARLTLVANQSVVDPYNSKTLAQFVLLGDPSIHPFAVAAEDTRPTKVALAERTQRRVRLAKSGERLGKTAAYTVPVAKPDARTRRLRDALRKRVHRKFEHVRAFTVRDPAPPKELAKAKGRKQPQRVFVAVREKKRDELVYKLIGLLAYEVDGQLVTMELESR